MASDPHAYAQDGLNPIKRPHACRLVGYGDDSVRYNSAYLIRKDVCAARRTSSACPMTSSFEL